MTARRIAARSWAGVSDPARSSTMASAARASAGSRTRWPDDDGAFSRLRIPARNAAFVPGRLTSRCRCQVQHLLGIPRPHAQHRTQFPAGELIPVLRHLRRTIDRGPGAGRRRISPPSRHACGRWHRPPPGPTRRSPRAAHRRRPAYRSSSPAVSSRNDPSAAQPGATSSGLPDANPAAGPAYSPGTVSADPGIPGPRRPPPPRRPRPAPRCDRTAPGLRRPGLIRGDLLGLGDQRSQLSVIQTGRGIVRVLVLLQVTGILILGPCGQVGLIPVRALRHQPPARGAEPGMITGSRGHPGRVLVPPGILGNRFLVHVPRPVLMNDLISNMVAKK